MASFIPLNKQLEDRLGDQVAKRLEKAIEVKKSLTNFGINNETCLDLKPFLIVLNDWVKDGKFAEGKIKLPEINRKLVYQLTSLKYTFVKLSQL